MTFLKKIFSRNIISFLLTLFCAFQVQAQIEIGAKAGVNFTNFNYTSDLDFGALNGEAVIEGAADLRSAQFRTAYHFGAYVSGDIGWLALQTEILFSQKGVKNYSVANDDWILNYLSVPVLLGFQPHDWFQIQLGPEFSYMLSNRIVIGDDKSGRENFFNKTDLGVALGASLDWPGPGLLSVRYVHGLGGVTLSDQEYNGRSFNNRNRTFQAAVAFPLYRYGKGRNL